MNSTLREFTDKPEGRSTVSQPNEIVYQSLKECSDDVLEVAREEMPDQKFGVAFYGEDNDRIEVITLDQSSPTLILHHKVTCMEITGFK